MNINGSAWFLVLSVVIGNFAYAQPQSMSLPRADGRWEHLTTDVQVDKQTFQSFSVKGGDNDGRRWTNAWIRYLNNEGVLFMANWTGFCDDRSFQIIRGVHTDRSGVEKKWEGYEAIRLHPGSVWEPVVDGLCQRSKQWWKVWQ